MDISATSSNTAAATGVNRMADLSSEEFVQILITELQNQDPFNPSDTNAMLEQISSIRNIDQSQTKNEEVVEQVDLLTRSACQNPGH